MDKTEEAIRAKLPPHGRCVPGCDNCGGQGWSHATKPLPGPGATVETCKGPSAPMFSLREMQDVVQELDAVRRALAEAERTLAALREARK